MTYEIAHNAQNELENIIPKNKKDFRLRTIEDHSSISSSDDELELIIMKFKKFMKQKLKNKKNAISCYERKKKEALWDESSSSKDKEKINKGEVENYALMTFDNEVNNSNETSLIYFKIT